ncbi:MAG: carboxypeptidase regulatory-like domain-containing protein [Saprospirales bacterium]|nr:carboxypeptidase regulatory-like domain-containing protein [Saprospirales bacterium]
MDLHASYPHPVYRSFVLVCGYLSAQTLTGTVAAPNGTPVPNARVTIFLNDTSMFREARTDANGVYFLKTSTRSTFFFQCCRARLRTFSKCHDGHRRHGHS